MVLEKIYNDVISDNNLRKRYGKHHYDINIEENNKNLCIVNWAISQHPSLRKDQIQDFIELYYGAEENTITEIANKTGKSNATIAQYRRTIILTIGNLLDVNCKDINCIDDIDDAITIRDVKIYNGLFRSGYTTNKDLYNIDYKKASKIRNLGRKGWIKLMEYMDKNKIPYVNDIAVDVEDKKKEGEDILEEKKEKTLEEKYNDLQYRLENLESVVTELINTLVKNK